MGHVDTFYVFEDASVTFWEIFGGHLLIKSTWVLETINLDQTPPTGDTGTHSITEHRRALEGARSMLSYRMLVGGKTNVLEDAL